MIDSPTNVQQAFENAVVNANSLKILLCISRKIIFINCEPLPNFLNGGISKFICLCFVGYVVLNTPWSILLKDPKRSFCLFSNISDTPALFCSKVASGDKLDVPFSLSLQIPK